MKNFILFLNLLLIMGSGYTQTDYPAKELSNKQLSVKVYLPDKENGYYRATRFDWSGVIGSLKYDGHEYFDSWLPYHDPLNHECINGPVEAFVPIDFDQARPGDPFLVIGVGVLQKPDDKPYHFSTYYKILDHGKWETKSSGKKIIFTQTLNHPQGYSYVYTKSVSLGKKKPELILDHQLTNRGTEILETTAYNHNFFVIDQEPTGPNIRTTFPFLITAEGRGFDDAITTIDSSLVFTRVLSKGESVYTANVEGHRTASDDHRIRIENLRTGAGVNITGDRPLHKLPYWASATTACPEPYIEIKVNPGSTFTWRTSYDFYSK